MVTKAQYKAAADRIRTGRSKDTSADNAICDAWERQQNATLSKQAAKSIWDLPIARRMWVADARDIER